MKYELYFFKEGNRYLDIDELFAYFNYCPYITLITKEDEVEARYYNEAVGLTASFLLTKVSRVPDIYRLNPKFLDLDIYLAIDPMLSLYKVGIVLDIVSDLCNKFGFYVYNTQFEDVSPYRKDLVLRSYEIVREAYRNKFPMEYSALNYVPKEKCNDLYKYLFEKSDLETYYQNEKYYFPTPYFVKSNSTGKIYEACTLEDNTLFVFPPQCDLLFYRNGDKMGVVYIDELQSVMGKFLVDLPGFIHSTKHLDKNGMKKIKKIISKTKFTDIKDTFSSIELDTIIDFK